MALAVFLGREETGVKEAPISAMIILITFHSQDSGLPLERFLEALIGGATALLINAVLPINPERMVEEATRPSSTVRRPCSRRWLAPWRAATPNAPRTPT